MIYTTKISDEVSVVTEQDNIAQRWVTHIVGGPSHGWQLTCDIEYGNAREQHIKAMELANASISNA